MFEVLKLWCHERLKLLKGSGTWSGHWPWNLRVGRCSVLPTTVWNETVIARNSCLVYESFCICSAWVAFMFYCVLPVAPCWLLDYNAEWVSLVHLSSSLVLITCSLVCRIWCKMWEDLGHCTYVVMELLSWHSGADNCVFRIYYSTSNWDDFEADVLLLFAGCVQNKGLPSQYQ